MTDLIDALEPTFRCRDGLITAVVQAADTRQVLMVGHMTREAVAATLECGEVTFWSRSRSRLWRKGETSGNTLRVVTIGVDCDADALLIGAIPSGPVCHNGTYSCFSDERRVDPLGVLARLETVIDRRRRDMPANSYTARLFAAGRSRMAQKVGEEGVEVVCAAMTGMREDLTGEAADLLYHLLVLLRSEELSLTDVAKVLEQRIA